MNPKKEFHIISRNNENNYNETPDCHIVGIGASAGGLEALEAFFSHVPRQDIPFAFVVVLHLAPDHKSLMSQLLAKHTHMKVYTIVDRTQIQSNHVYLIPPKSMMTVNQGILYLHEKRNTKMPSFPIDVFFQSLAKERGERAIAIILSGTGSDGTRGMKDIKEVGGMVMVQEPETAKFDGMPRNAMATGLVDYVLPATEMPEELINYVEYASKQVLKGDRHSYLDDSYIQIMKVIKKETNIDFTSYKRNTILRRIKRKMEVNKFERLEEYANYLKQETSEVKGLQKELLIGVTKFFRDTEAFNYLEEKVIPEIFEGVQNNEIRVWTVACSTGEEAYTLAILFHEYEEKINSGYDIKIFATDIDREAIQQASMGVYSESSAADISLERLNKYFVRVGENYQANRLIRDMIIFTVHDITRDPPFNKLDLISCRNVLIYFQAILQRKVFTVFNFALKQGGHLFLGSSESADEYRNFFTVVNARWKIWRSVFNAKLLNLSEYEVPSLKISNYVAGSLPKSNYRKSYELQELNAINELIIEEYISACILVNENYEYIRYFGNAHKYLRVPRRSDSWNILSMIVDKLSVILGTGIRKALQQQKTIRYNNVQLLEQGTKTMINLLIKPYTLANSKQTLLLIIIEELEEQLINKESEDYYVDNSVNQHVQDLEQELKITRENLQATIEELQTSNEELIASNEELQSTNEELQSVNEELHTINSEHQANILELTELNDDINNLLQSTKIGILFLDNGLRIRKFNQSIKEEVNITQDDIGRPVAHFSLNIQGLDLIGSAKKVLQDFLPIQREVQNKNGIWYLMRILPYKTAEKQVKGVVITFVNINELKEAEQLKKVTTSLQQEIKDRKNVVQQLEQQKHMLKLLVSSISDLYFKIKADGHCLELKVGEHFLPKIEEEKVIGYSIYQFMPDDLADMAKNAIQTALDMQEEVVLQYDWKVDTNIYDYEIHVYPAKDQSVIGIVKING